MKKLIVLLLALLSFNASALTIDVQQSKRPYRIFVYLSGTIVNGDDDRIIELLKRYQGYELVFAIDSQGGSLREGIDIGYTFYMSGHPVVIANKASTRAECNSSCALAFLGARSKYINENSQLGVHRFYSNQAKKGGKADAYQNEQAVQYITSRIYQYAREVNIPNHAIDTMFKTPSHTMYFFTPKEMRELGIEFLK